MHALIGGVRCVLMNVTTPTVVRAALQLLRRVLVVVVPHLVRGAVLYAALALAQQIAVYGVTSTVTERAMLALRVVRHHTLILLLLYALLHALLDALQAVLQQTTRTELTVALVHTLHDAAPHAVLHAVTAV